MNAPTRLLIALFLGASQAPAQEPLRFQVGGCANATTMPTSWEESPVTEDFASLRYDELPGETTLLFVHTTIHITPENQRVASGVMAVYPFLRRPDETWTGSALAQLSQASFSVSNTEVPLGIPPERVARHVRQFLDELEPRPASYGTNNSSTQVQLRNYTLPLPWPTGLAGSDERNAWGATTWTPGHPIFDVSRLGRGAVIQAAYHYALPLGSVVLSQDALTALNNMMDTELGFEIYVQAAFLTTAGPPALRLSQCAVIRKTSLSEIVPDPWFTAMGPHQWVPDLINAGRRLFLGFLGDEFQVEFDHEVSGLRAWIMTTTGLVEATQMPNPTYEGLPLCPRIARFPFPANALSGVVYFDDFTQIVPPLYHMELGALVLALPSPQ